ncbi:MAG: hypothetical protein WD830_11815 [Chloroflexota bacterium]
MKEPFFRPAPPEGSPSLPCPDGLVAHAAGIWHGRAMEVVYDTARHDIAFLRGGVSPNLEHGMRSVGYEHRLTDGSNQMWIRDRAALARRRLDHVRSTHAVPRIA